MKIRFFSMLTALLLCVLLTANALAETAPECFFRFDLDETDAWQKPLSDVRFLTESAWSLTPIDPEKCEKYGISPDARPDTTGLDTLHISGSAEFSETQFLQLAAELRELAGNREIWIVDCRLESHALVNGISISWYGDHNWANKGLSLAEAEADETQRFGTLPGQTITVFTAKNNVPENPQEITAESCLTERELVEGEGFRYLRLAANDHSWPEEKAVETFIAFVDELDAVGGPDSVWLHFHCHAGKSRTGIFMAIYDMMRNPEISFDDIMLRHAMTGSSYFPYADPASDIVDVYALRAQRIRQVYDYLHSRPDGEARLPWCEWLAQAEGRPSPEHL